MSELPTASVKPGDVIAGRYEVQRVLGAGGMGVVVEARHVNLDQRVAIKLMRLGPGSRSDAHLRRFHREARIAALLRSQHVARVLDADRTPTGDPFIAMEFLEGHDLEAEIAGRGKLPFADAVGYVLQACEGLAEAHAAGIVHRDLKPSNLFLTRHTDGRPLVKILDFGISKADTSDSEQITSTSTSLGSPAFMSPEQIRSSRSVDARTDVWSMGVVLYRLCTGALPFSGDDATAVLARVLIDPPARPGTDEVPDALWAVIERCLQKDREARYPDVAAFAHALVPFARERDRVHAEHAERVMQRQRASVEPTAAALDSGAAIRAAIASQAQPPPHVNSLSSAPATAQPDPVVETLHPLTGTVDRPRAKARGRGRSVVGAIAGTVLAAGLVFVARPRDDERRTATNAAAPVLVPAPAPADAAFTAPAAVAPAPEPEPVKAAPVPTPPRRRRDKGKRAGGSDVFDSRE